MPLLLDAGHDVRVLVRKPEQVDFDKRISVVKGGL